MNRILERLLGANGKAGQSPLSGKLGVKMLDGHEGRWSTGGLEARVFIEPDDWIHVEGAVTRPPEPIQALRRGHTLPGNVRFAITASTTSLFADTRLDGFAHLPATFAELKAGLARAVTNRESAPKRVGDAGALAKALETVLTQLGWDEERLRKRDDGWELRVRTEGRWHAVTVAAAEGDVRCCIPLFTVNPAHAEPLAMAALQLNAQVRFARYALDGEELLAESRLHAGLLSAQWVQSTARAVAVAASHGRRLRLLAECDEVRQWYTRVFPAQGDGSGTEEDDYEETGCEASASLALA
jgi:hypothetical protein